MANFSEVHVIAQDDIVYQITGLGDQMGIDIIIKAPDTKKIVVSAGATVQLNWTDTIGAQTLAKALVAGEINDSTGLTLGTYYPDGQVFTNQGEVDAFMGVVAAKIYKATIADEV